MSSNRRVLLEQDNTDGRLRTRLRGLQALHDEFLRQCLRLACDIFRLLRRPLIAQASGRRTVNTVRLPGTAPLQNLTSWMHAVERGDLALATAVIEGRVALH
ncbi:hypothetical protein D9M72_378930 [compost metagenome]